MFLDYTRRINIEWTGVENITSLTKEHEIRQKKEQEQTRKHQHIRFYVAQQFRTDPIDLFQDGAIRSLKSPWRWQLPIFSYCQIVISAMILFKFR